MQRFFVSHTPWVWVQVFYYESRYQSTDFEKIIEITSFFQISLKCFISHFWIDIRCFTSLPCPMAHWEELLQSVSDFIFSKHCGYRSRGVRGIKRQEILWEIKKYSLPGQLSSQSWVKSKTTCQFLRNLMNFLMVFDFIQFWLDGWPGNEYFWISLKISGHLTPLTPLGVHPQCLLKM